MSRFVTANTVINRAALECGLLPVNDPVSSADESFVQLTGLLTSCGQELVEIHPWQGLRKKFSFTTQAGDTGSYELPDDFGYMIDQTGWNKSGRLPVWGPLSAQEWSFLDGADFLDTPMYAMFQLENNELQLYPQPPPEGIEIAFQYISRNWAQQPNTNPPITQDTIETGQDIVLYEPIMVVKYLTTKFKSAKGFDASVPAMEFERIFLSRTGKDAGASVLNAARSTSGLPMLGYNNAPWSGYGS